MNLTCISDCYFQPGSRRLSVEDAIEHELSLIKSGIRRDIPYDLTKPINFDPEFYRKNGYKYIHIAEYETASDLAIKAINALIEKNGLTPNDIDGFIYYDTTPSEEDIAINVPCKVAQAVGFSDLLYQTYLTQKNCTSSLAAIETACYLLNANHDISWVIVAGGDRIDAENGTPRVIHNELYGDAGSAVLLGRRGYPIRYIRSRPFPIGWKRHYESPEVFRNIAMNYFRWSMKEINAALKSTECEMKDLEYILTNQERIYDMTRDIQGFEENKLRFFKEHLANYGHTLSHEIVEEMLNVIDAGFQKQVLIHATGIGTNMATMIMEPTNIGG